MNINIKYRFVGTHINCDAKECMYGNFNYLVICDDDKMPKYCPVKINCYLYPGHNCVLPGTRNHRGICTCDSILFQDSIQKWRF